MGEHAILLEYPPPDPLHERWGWGSPSNEALADLFDRSADAYGGAIDLIERYGPELRQIPRSPTGRGEPFWDQTWFTSVDAAALYCFIRERHPSRYHEIGSGRSTLFAARAIRDGELSTRILSVDPQPRGDVDSLCDEILRAPLQRIDLGRVRALSPGDLLLIDSSHVALKDSDVVAFFLDVLPALPAGVLIGVHDVFLPDDYPWWLADRWYSEQYLLAAWLLGRDGRAKVVFPTHYCATNPSLRAELEAAWRGARLHGTAYGSTLWLES